jgi:hypothetical protein
MRTPESGDPNFDMWGATPGAFARATAVRELSTGVIIGTDIAGQIGGAAANKDPLPGQEPNPVEGQIGGQAEYTPREPLPTYGVAEPDTLPDSIYGQSTIEEGAYRGQL